MVKVAFRSLTILGTFFFTADLDMKAVLGKVPVVYHWQTSQLSEPHLAADCNQTTDLFSKGNFMGKCSKAPLQAQHQTVLSVARLFYQAPLAPHAWSFFFFFAERLKAVFDRMQN